MNILRLLVVCVAGLFSVLPSAPAAAQGCNDVAILFREPDCYKPRAGTAPGSTGNNKACARASACEKEKYTYSAAGGPWATYAWTILSGPAIPALSPSASTASVSVVWPVPGTYVLSLTVTDGSGSSFTKCLEISVKEKPFAGFTFSPNNACPGSSIGFTNTTTFSGTAMYAWNFGDPLSGAANVSAAANPAHAFSGAGTYWVTLVAYSSTVVNVASPNHTDIPSILTCCADTFRALVTVASGNVKIDCISTVCPGKRVTYTAVGCATPVWGAPVGGTVVSTSGNAITVQWGSGSPQGQLSVNCGGCTSYATVPIVPATPIVTGPLNPCQSGSASYTAPYLPGTDYQWTLTNLTTGLPENNLLSTYPENNTAWVNWGQSTPGTSYQLSLTIQNNHICCGGKANITITPRQTFAINSQPSVCAGSSAGFFPDVPGTYTWTAAPTTGVTPPGSPGANFNAVFNTPGNYTVTATNTGTNTCNTTASTSISVVAIPVPGSISGPSVACANNPYPYSMTVPAPAGYYYQWTVISGTFQPLAVTSTSGNAVVAQFSSLPATIIVSLQQSVAPYCSVAADTVVVTGATPGSITGPTQICVDSLVNYSLSGALPAGTVVTWSVSPASLGTITAGQGGSPVTILWHGTGGSGPWGPATVSAATGCGTVTPLGGIMVSPKFVVNISPSGTDVCQVGGMSLTANGAPAGAGYTWLPGAGSSQTLSGISAPGIYTVTATAGGCKAIRSYQLEDPFQIRAISCGVPICTSTGISEVLGVEVYKPASGTFTYEWHSGTCTAPGPIIQTITNASTLNQFTATSPGNYCVVVKYGNCQKCVGFLVKNSCCPDINQPSVTNNTQLSCNQYSFTATTPNPGGSTITWDFGDGTSQPGTSGTAVTHNYLNAGIYCVTFCVGPPSPNPSGCTGNCAATTAVVPIQPQFTWKLGCNGCLQVTNTSLVYGNSAYVSYSWNWGDVTPATTGANPAAHCYPAGGSYTVTLSMTYNDGTISCTRTFPQTVTFTPLAISNTSPVCAGVPASFSSSPGGFLSYNWSFGDGFNGFTAPIQHAYNTAGSYTITLSVLDELNNTCTKTDVLPVNPGFGSCAIQPGYICPGSSAMLTAPAGAASYQWQVETSPGVFANAPGTSTGVTYTTATPGFYRVILTNASGCTCTTPKVSVIAVPKPKAGFTVDPGKRVCGASGNVLLTAAATPGYTYEWFMNGSYGSPFSGNAAVLQPVSATTIFNLVVTNQYGCKDTCSQAVTVTPLPAQPSISTSAGFCAGVATTLTVTNYTNNISWSTGDTTQSVVAFTAGSYIATYTDPATGCSASTSFLLRRRPSSGLFPHNCDSIPCNCSRPFTIYAPKPLLGGLGGGYSISWYSSPGNVLLASGPSYNNAGNGVQTGGYYIVLRDSATNCYDTSNIYSVIVPSCDTCDCKGSSWGKINLYTGTISSPAKPATLSCGKRVNLSCNQAYTLAALFNCKDSACNGKVTYTLQPPVGNPVTGIGTLTFTPPVSGMYTAKIYGYCGSKPCDSCLIYFIVDCPCDCKGSSWGPVTLSGSQPHTDGPVASPAASTKPIILSCRKNYVLECNKPYTINASYFCADSSCNSKLTYLVIPPGGVPVTGTLPFTATPSVSGTYTMTIYGWCGKTICDSCTITFTVVCPCSCKESKWGKIVMTKGYNDSTHLDKIGEPPVTLVALACKKTYDLDCRSPYSFTADYFCKDSSCPGKVTYKLQPPGGPAIAGTMPMSFTPMLSGIYTLTIYGWCGDVICDSCTIKFNLNCDCCKGSKWKSKTITDGTAVKNLKCDTYKWACNQSFGIDAVYDCATDACGASTSYKLVPPLGPVQTGALPLNYTPAAGGVYTVILYGYCGSQLCDSCVATFKVECPPKDSSCCKHDITVKPTVQTYSPNVGIPATVLSQGFSVTGLTGVPLSEVRAEVLSFDIGASFEDCMACKSLPFIWASTRAAAAISGVNGLVTMYGGAATSVFNPTGAAVYQNPREVVWNNGSGFMINGALQIDFFLPAAPKPDCCRLHGRICVKFTFRGVDCSECTTVTCFDVAIP